MDEKIKKDIDAPIVPITLFLCSGIIIIFFFLNKSSLLFVFLCIILIFLLLELIFYLHTSLWGKQRIWSYIFKRQSLWPGAQVLDLGCGNGGLMILLHQMTKHPIEITGIDMWRKQDQSRNSYQKTLHNLKASGYLDKSKIFTGNILKLPFSHNKFDLIFSNMVLHNIHGNRARKKALEQVVRVLKPGGKVIIGDLSYNQRFYVKTLKSLGLKNIIIKDSGINGWWGLPLLSRTTIVSGIKK